MEFSFSFKELLFHLTGVNKGKTQQNARSPKAELYGIIVVVYGGE